MRATRLTSSGSPPPAPGGECAAKAERAGFEQQQADVGRLKQARESGDKSMAPAKCAEGWKLRRREGVEQPLPTRLGDIEERASEADGGHARDQLEIRRPIGEQHTDESYLRRERAERRLEPLKRAGVGRNPNLIHAGRGKRASLRREGAGLVGEGAERGADPASPADHRDALPDGLERDRSERPLRGIDKVDNVRAALQDERRFRRIDDAGQH